MVLATPETLFSAPASTCTTLSPYRRRTAREAGISYDGAKRMPVSFANFTSLVQSQAYRRRSLLLTLTSCPGKHLQNTFLRAVSTWLCLSTRRSPSKTKCVNELTCIDIVHTILEIHNLPPVILKDCHSCKQQRQRRFRQGIAETETAILR
jgi:hypothetical protein